MRTAEEQAMVVEQLENICIALPWCQGLNWRFSDLKKDALADLYAALEGLSLRFCELLPIQKGPTTKNSLGIALAKYLYDHPERCQATLLSLNRSTKLSSTASLLAN